jgi:hypothetical protein
MSDRMLLNVTNSDHKQRCLLKYITLPFCYPPVYHRHQNMWQVPRMAEIISSLGYNVDVIDYDAVSVKLPNKYNLLIDIFPQHNTVYQGNLAQDCKKILFATGSAPGWQTGKEAERLEQLYQRRGTRLPAKAIAQPYPDNIATFDALFFFGNQHTLATYDSVPITKKFLITNAAYQLLQADSSRKQANTFLYYATYPQVLKGLDLLLEVFAANPAVNLIICSRFSEEKDFSQLYAHELYEYPNILAVGPVDILSGTFAKIAQIASYVILPSCSEGMSGCVITAMAAGLIPIVSAECGLDSSDAYILPNCSVDGISDCVNYFAAQSRQWVIAEANRFYNIARKRYSPGCFENSFRSALGSTLTK